MNDQATVGVHDQFQTDLVKSWRQLPNKTFFFVLLAVWLSLFQFLGNATMGYIDTPSLFRWMWLAYTSHLPDGTLTDDSLGLWVPVVVLALFWLKRAELTALRLRTWWPGLALVLAGLLIHLLGYVMQQPRISIAALFLGLYGLTGLAWGPEWLKRTYFPFFLFVFCVPLSTALESVTFPLRLLASWIVEKLCHLVLAIDVIRDGTILRDPLGKYQYEVAGACSGIRSLISIGLMATWCGW